MKDPVRPIPESYWVVVPQLLAGEYPGHLDVGLTRRRLEAFLEAGFDMFIDLTQPGETRPYADILQEAAGIHEQQAAYRRFPIGDFGLPTSAQMNAVLDTIDEGLKAGHKIYLHCWGGIGRTGTTVGCYLVRHGRTGAEALDQLAAWWRCVPKSRYHPYSPETSQQVDFIRSWPEHNGKK